MLKSVIFIFSLSFSVFSFGKDTNIKETYVQVQKIGQERFSICVNSSQLPNNRWIFRKTKNGFVVNNLPQGEYYFSVSPSGYESYANEFVATKKVNITNEKQIIKIILPKTSANLKINLSQFNLKKLFKNKKTKNYSIIGKLEKYEDNKITPYCQWLFLSPEEIIKKPIKKNVNFVAHGSYRITFFINYKIAGKYDDLDDYILGFIKFEVTSEQLNKKIIINLE